MIEPFPSRFHTGDILKVHPDTEGNLLDHEVLADAEAVKSLLAPNASWFISERHGGFATLLSPINDQKVVMDERDLRKVAGRGLVRKAGTRNG